MQYAIKSTTGSVEMIRMINRIGDDVSYTPLEELETSLCIQKLQIQKDEHIALLEHIHPHVPTTLAFGNIYRIEETLSGAGTSHCVNGIAVQASVYGDHQPREPTQAL